MTPRKRIARLSSLAGFAAGGLLLAHGVTYMLVVPSGIHRHALLVRTGHGYLPFVVSLAAGAVAVAAVVATAAGYVRSRTGRGDAPGLAPNAARLAVVQGLAFAALEVLERILAGAPIADLAGPLLWVGLAIQVVVGLLGAFLVACLDGVGAALGSLRTHRSAAPKGSLLRVTVVAVRRRSRGTKASRAPPAALSHAV